MHNQKTASFLVSADCLNLGLRAGAVLFRGIRVEPASPALRQQILQAVQTCRAKYPDLARARSLPELIGFHDILRKVGANPRRDQPSVDRLLGWALKKNALPAINNLVDAYNLVSLKSLCSLGAHDLDKIDLPVELRLLNGQEAFVPLGKSETAPVAAGEFGYVDGRGRLLCRLDVIQADFSKVTSATTRAILIVEGTASHSLELLNRTIDQAIDQILEHCGGTAEKVPVS